MVTTQTRSTYNSPIPWIRVDQYVTFDCFHLHSDPSTSPAFLWNRRELIRKTFLWNRRELIRRLALSIEHKEVHIWRCIVEVFVYDLIWSSNLCSSMFSFSSSSWGNPSRFKVSIRLQFNKLATKQCVPYTMMQKYFLQLSTMGQSRRYNKHYTLKMKGGINTTKNITIAKKQWSKRTTKV